MSLMGRHFERLVPPMMAASRSALLPLLIYLRNESFLFLTRKSVQEQKIDSFLIKAIYGTINAQKSFLNKREFF